MKKETIIRIITAVIAALFFYAAFSKLSDFDKSKWEMSNQVFPSSIAQILAWLIPAIEIALTILLLISQTRKVALRLSLLLLSAFTIYIAVVMTGVFGRIPCSCGGILKNMSYGTHLVFNLFFASLAFLGLALDSGWIQYNRLFYHRKKGYPTKQC